MKIWWLCLALLLACSNDETSVGGSFEDGGMTGCEGGPLGAPISGCMPEPLAPSGDFEADCVARINQLRWECQCLPPLQRWQDGEACASQHAEHDQSLNKAHDGFATNICEPKSFAQNECPGWSRETHVDCLQQMWNEGPGADFSKHGHYINMTSDKYSMVACGISADGTWSVQNFR